jgi:NADPH:quinone reductase-like Zn-dependent oxidoreductase
MRAVTVTEYGATPAVAEVPTPKPGPGQVLIKLRAAGMNPMDRTLASGAWKPMPATFPMVLGADGAGVVEQLGEGASRFSLGDDLFGQLLIPPLGSAGTYAEYVAVTEDAPLARVPSGLDDVVAAALPSVSASLARATATACPSGAEPGAPPPGPRAGRAPVPWSVRRSRGASVRYATESGAMPRMPQTRLLMPLSAESGGGGGI